MTSNSSNLRFQQGLCYRRIEASRELLERRERFSKTQLFVFQVHQDAQDGLSCTGIVYNLQNRRYDVASYIHVQICIVAIMEND